MDTCINKFLMDYNQVNVEKHSDSSDFDETPTTSYKATKSGKHSIRDKKQIRPKSTKKVNVAQNRKPINMENRLSDWIENNMIPVRDVNANHNHSNLKLNNISNNVTDEVILSQLVNKSKITQPRTVRCFSSILRRPSEYEKHIPSIKEIPEDALHNGKAFCACCERRRVKKLNRRRRSYVVQPVQVVHNAQGRSVPFGHSNDPAPLPRHTRTVRKQDSTSYELTSSESDIGKTDKTEHVTRRRNFIEQFQKEMRREYMKYEKELLRHRMQQYPSIRNHNTPTQVYSTPYIQMHNEVGTEAQESNIPSTSSGFWEYIFEKIRGKRSEKVENPKHCKCTENNKFPLQTTSGYPDFDLFTENLPDCQSCTQQTEDITPKAVSKTPMKSGKKNVNCKCYSNKKHKHPKTNDSRKPTTQAGDTSPPTTTRPCQEPHDDITRTVEQKYNGEILCIHNPPCILINGCLNLPGTADRPTIQGNLWPVTQDKKMSFYQMCRKIRRPKRVEQACQYHPPSAAVQAMRIKTEKNVQSICNHDPPCEVVYGCYKPKYDPKLQNSCVHVPMCQRMPECLISDNGRRDKPESKLCEHKPKCTEVPLCSKKFVILTARETVGTQVRPKTKLVCRHEPPCIMIPKCLARVISDSFIPYEAIPDCVHQPCCDMIPACCRRVAKETVSVSSQYPNAPCPIV